MQPEGKDEFPGTDKQIPKLLVLGNSWFLLYAKLKFRQSEFNLAISITFFQALRWRVQKYYSKIHS